MVGSVPHAAVSHSPLPFQAQPLLHGEPKSTSTDSQLHPAPLSRGLARSKFPCFGTPGSTGKIGEDATSQLERTEGMPDNCSTTWDIELEDGILPSDSSSFACGTTVVIDTGKIWSHQGGVRQFHQTAVDSCGNPRSVATRSPDGYSRSSPRVASRFFSKRVSSSSLRKDRPAPRTTTLDWDDNPDGEPEVPTLDGFGYYRCDVGWDRSSNQETDSFSGVYCGTHLSPLAGTYIRVLDSDESDYSRQRSSRNNDRPE